VDWRGFGKYWMPVLVWMGLIFLLSTDLGSARQTSRFIGPLLRWVWPAVTEAQIGRAQLAARKTGHVTGYAILAVLALRGVRRGMFVSGWRGRGAVAAWMIASLYAMTDEIHQSMVPTRMASAGDVALDSFGAALGVALAWMIGRRRGLW
jgi:VanZ family protein